jgi:uncharacterized membrane protein
LVLIEPALATTTSSAYIPDQYAKGVVVHIDKEEKTESNRVIQHVEVKITSGPETGRTVSIQYGDIDGIASRQKVAIGDSIIVIKIPDGAHSTYFISDFNRTPWLIFLTIIFFAAVFLCGGWRGLTSLTGLISTVAILLLYIVPRIIAGDSPITTVLIGTTAIILVSMFFAHGFNTQTTVAVASTFITLIFAISFALLAVKLARLFGTGTEEAMYIQLGNATQIDLRGVLLGGIIIGTIGVLDDVTTAQTAAAHEIFDARPTMHFGELCTRVMRVGREHIASLVNTLVLAYAGASFPLFLLLYATKETQPLWIVLNSQQMAEEIVRTVVGSTTLVLAVPLSSALAAWYYTRHHKKI